MLEAEREIAGLEAYAFAAMENADGDALGHNIRDSLCQRFVLVRRTIVQKLYLEAVGGPVEFRGRRNHAQRQSPFIANRQLHQHAR